MRILIKTYKLICFLVFYFYDLTLSACKISLDVLTVENLSHPGIVKIPLDAKTDWEIAMIANLITFSPGSMVVDLSADKRIMFVHSMFVEDQAKVIYSIKQNIERRVLEVLR